MAFLAQAGYRLSRGRIQKGMPWIVLGSVVIGILVANAIEIAIGLSQDPEIGCFRPRKLTGTCLVA